jgi:hypothetical protein
MILQFFSLAKSAWRRSMFQNPWILHCLKSVLKIQENIHEGANHKFYITVFLNVKLFIPEQSPT